MIENQTMNGVWNQSSSCPLSSTTSSVPSPSAMSEARRSRCRPTSPSSLQVRRIGDEVVREEERQRCPTGTLMKKTQRQS